ncbi:MAG: hypothetical protein P8181_05585 [bacterium]
MKNILVSITAILMMAAAVVSAGVAGNTAGEKRSETAAKTTTDAKPTQSPDEQIAGLDAMCAANADERAARHAETPLFERLGGEEGIHALTREIVRLHLQNPAIKYMFDDLDADKVAHRVALFMISGTGGPASYDGETAR